MPRKPILVSDTGSDLDGRVISVDPLQDQVKAPADHLPADVPHIVLAPAGRTETIDGVAYEVWAPVDDRN
jgi:hypothetical protein